MQHANDTGALAVRDGVEDLVDLGGRTDWHLDRMAALQAVELESTAIVAVYELRPDVEFGQAVIHAQVLDPRGKALVEPQVSPPFLKIQNIKIFKIKSLSEWN